MTKNTHSKPSAKTCESSRPLSDDHIPGTLNGEPANLATVTVNAAELAACLHIHRRTVYDYVTLRMPKEPDGKFNLCYAMCW